MKKEKLDDLIEIYKNKGDKKISINKYLIKNGIETLGGVILMTIDSIKAFVYLKEAGLPINIDYEEDVIIAAEEEDVELANYLLMKNNNFDITRALLKAIRNNSINMIELLIRSKKTINLKDYSPIELALRNKNIKIINCLIDNKIFNKSDEPYILLGAIINNLTPIITKLVKNGIDINFNTVTANHISHINYNYLVYYTPLINSIIYCDKEVTKFLIEQGAVIDKKENNGESPLSIASQKDDLELIQLMIKNEKDIDVVKKNAGAKIKKWIEIKEFSNNLEESLKEKTIVSKKIKV